MIISIDTHIYIIISFFIHLSTDVDYICILAIIMNARVQISLQGVKSHVLFQLHVESIQIETEANYRRVIVRG